MTEPEKKLKFGLIEIGRGLAAAAVVLHHSDDIGAETRFFGRHSFGYHLGNFNVGVDFFFVLSGFIITWVHWADFRQKSRLSLFVRKRFLRIFPPYWFVMIPLAIAYSVNPTAGDPWQHDPFNIFLSTFLIPQPAHPVLGVAWTLTYEVFFYCLFGISLVLGRNSLWLLAVWSAAIITIGQSDVAKQFPMSFLLSPYNLEFAMGVGAAAVLRKKTIPAPWFVLIVGSAGFMGLMLFAQHIQDNPLVGRLSLGSCAVAFVLGSVEVERQYPVVLPRGLLTFGAASYAMYLIHPVALSFFLHPVRSIAYPYLSVESCVVIASCLACFAGVAYHLGVERPLARFGKRILA